MNPFASLPNGVAEFVLFFGGVLFLVFLYFQDRFGKKKNSDDWSPEQCAISTARTESIFKTIKEMADRRHELECQIVDQNKALMKIIEDNTRANVILAERLK